MSKYKTTHLPPSEIDRLLFKAFATNGQEDVNAYHRAASLYFQERDVRAMNRADRIEELEGKLAKAEVIIHIIASDKWDERLGEAVDLSCEYLAELTGET
jgi:hypothetical protein